MWYLSDYKIDMSVDNPGESLVHAHGILSTKWYAKYPIILTLSNSETKETLVLTSDNMKQLRDTLTKLRPYGIFNFSMDEEKFCAFVVADEKMVRFLDYVDSVETSIIGPLHPLYYDLIEGGVVFHSRDELMSLFSFVVDMANAPERLEAIFDGYLHEGYCDLLQIACFLPTMFHKNQYFIRGRTAVDGIVVYKVNFTDVKLAQRFITKLVVNGYNPFITKSCSLYL